MTIMVGGLLAGYRYHPLTSKINSDTTSSLLLTLLDQDDHVDLEIDWLDCPGIGILYAMVLGGEGILLHWLQRDVAVFLQCSSTLCKSGACHCNGDTVCWFTQTSLHFAYL